MEKTLINCKNCKKPFMAKTSEINRGQGFFCSRSCNAIHSNKNRKPIDKICKVCNIAYQSKCSTSKYCSTTCKKNIRPADKSQYKYNLNAKIDKIASTKYCYNCGYNRTTCDVHHIIARRNGGSDDHSNLTVLCPNCHREADKKLLSMVGIPTVADKIDLLKRKPRIIT